MQRCAWMVCLLLAGNALAQPNPMLRIDATSVNLYQQAERFAKAGDAAGVIAVWQARADRGDDLAQLEIANVLLSDPALKEGARAVDLLRRSAASGFVRAQTRLGLLLRDGLPPHLAADPAQSFQWIKRAADQGYGIALVQLGLAYVNGIGVAPDPKLAFELFQRSARQDQPFGHFAVGAAYESGIGVSVDVGRARESYRLAVERSLWFQSRQGFPYVFRPAFDKWVDDSRAALAGLDGTPRPVAPAATAPARAPADDGAVRVAEERRRLEAEQARLAAERRRMAEDQARRQAAEAKRAEEARLAEERRRLEAERTRLAEERRRLEEENRRAAEEERRQAAERKAAEEARLAEERRRVEAEQARIADERRKLAEAESRAKAQAEQAASSPPPPAAKPAAPARPAGDSDFAASFGRFVRGLAKTAQVVAGVAVAVSGARAGDDARVNQGVDLIMGTAGMSRSGPGGTGTAGAGGTDPRNVTRDQCIVDWTKARDAMAEVVRQSNQYAQHLDTPGAPYRPARPVEDCRRNTTYQPAQRDFQEVNALMSLCGVMQATCVIDRVSSGEECAPAMDSCKAEHPVPSLAR